MGELGAKRDLNCLRRMNNIVRTERKNGLRVVEGNGGEREDCSDRVSSALPPFLPSDERP